MGTHDVTVGAADSARVSYAENLRIAEERPQEQASTPIDFRHTKNSNYATNTKSNVFLKQYLEGKALASGVKIPEGMTIHISSPQEFSEDYKKLLHHVRVDIYKARVADMFKLLSQDVQTVRSRVEKMDISDEDKASILELKNEFDNYYRVEAKLGDKTYNLLRPSEEEKAQLQQDAPEFAQFIKDEQADLVEQTTEFARGEIEKVELAESGTTSRYGAMVLAPVLSGLIVKDIWQGRLDKKAMAADMKGFLAEQKEIYEKGDPTTKMLKGAKAKIKNFKFSNLKKLGKGSLNPLKMFKGSSKSRLIGIVGLTLAGSADDIAGCVKDWFQDADNFGAGTATGVAIPSAALGVASSLAVAPMIEDQIAYNKAVKHLTKNGILTKSAGLKAMFKKGGKTALAVGLATTAGKFVIDAAKGCVTTSSSSGSSWGSMAGTRYVMANNGDKLEEKGIISHEENTSAATNENMMSYEAYKGKWEGISKSDPILGVAFGGLGLLTHSNPIIQSAAFATQGSSETITACAYQMLGDDIRGDELADKKEKLVASVNPQS